MDNDFPIKTYLVLEKNNLNLQFALPQHPVIGYRQIARYGKIEVKYSVIAHYTMIGQTSNPKVNIYEFRGVEVK